MGLRHEQYAKDLVTLHGQPYAIKMMEKALEVSKRANILTYFDEADFSISDGGKYEYAKTQSGKKNGLKEKRQKQNINFYSEVLKLLRKVTNGKPTATT